MTELSLCMIVKNEEERLARCLSGVQGAVDEIIIVDTGSTDGTKRVAGGGLLVSRGDAVQTAGVRRIRAAGAV